MLMVVIGAGASYDSVPHRRPDVSQNFESRPPLANELFADRNMFAQIMTSFPQCLALVPRLRDRPDGRSVEQILEQIQSEVPAYPVRLQQLAAIRYYISTAIYKCELEWSKIAMGVTNYNTLLDDIERWRDRYGRVCFVTFNYDTMLETALLNVGFATRSLADYISSEEYKIIKLHGSVNWARQIATRVDRLHRDPDTIAQELIARVAELEITDNYQLIGGPPAVKNGDGTMALFPAIAIPVETKRQHECPHEHEEALKQCIPQVTKLLVIGWRGMEEPFLKFLAGIHQGVPAMIVAGSERGAQEVADRLHGAIVGLQFNVTAGGFTHFVLDHQGRDFLSS